MFASYDQNGTIIGFYDPEIHGENIPVNSIEITDEQWRDCIENQGLRKIDPVTKNIIILKPIPPTEKELALAELETLDRFLPRCVEDIITAAGIADAALPQIMRDRLIRKRELRTIVAAQ